LVHDANPAAAIFQHFVTSSGHDGRLTVCHRKKSFLVPSRFEGRIHVYPELTTLKRRWSGINSIPASLQAVCLLSFADADLLLCILKKDTLIRLSGAL
jgi:hypothetical protein